MLGGLGSSMFGKEVAKRAFEGVNKVEDEAPSASKKAKVFIADVAQADCEQACQDRIDALISKTQTAYTDAQKIVSESTESITAYVVSKVTCSAGQALVMTIIISPIGFDLPGWFLFGILCFLLDFIPILGALFATIPPVIIAFIMLEPLSAVLMVALLIGNQQVFASFVEPNLSGSKIGISPFVLLLTVMLFSQVWGIAGAIIGAPIVIIARLILDENEATRPVAMMMANTVEEE